MAGSRVQGTFRDNCADGIVCGEHDGGTCTARSLYSLNVSENFMKSGILKKLVKAVLLVPHCNM